MVKTGFQQKKNKKKRQPRLVGGMHSMGDLMDGDHPWQTRTTNSIGTPHREWVCVCVCVSLDIPMLKFWLNKASSPGRDITTTTSTSRGWGV